MPKSFRRLTWVRAGNRYPDLKGERDHFLALDGEVEVGVVKLVTTGAPEEGQFQWSMLLTHPGPEFRRPTSGTCLTRGAAALELLNCWRAFRDWLCGTLLVGQRSKRGRAAAWEILMSLIWDRIRD